jgi:hypothetical protein
MTLLACSSCAWLIDGERYAIVLIAQARAYKLVKPGYGDVGFTIMASEIVALENVIASTDCGLRGPSKRKSQGQGCTRRAIGR